MLNITPSLTRGLLQRVTLNVGKKYMLDDYGFEIFEQNEFPIAYLLTWRTYGTWLHGDKRWSVGRTKNNRYGESKIEPSKPLLEVMSELSSVETFTLDAAQRDVVDETIREVCRFREYTLHALNVRSNHAHAVVAKAVKPEKIVNDFKAYATRALRRKWQILYAQKVWSRGASTRYLWKPKHVEAAVDYVLYCQEDIPFEFKD